MDHIVFFRDFTGYEKKVFRNCCAALGVERITVLIRGFTRNALIGDTIGNDREPKTVCDTILSVIMNMAT